MRCRSIDLVSFNAFVLAATWFSTAAADTVVWCHPAISLEGKEVITCDKDMGGGDGNPPSHLGPDGGRNGTPVAPGQWTQIPRLADHSMYRLFQWSTSDFLLTQSYDEAVHANEYDGFSYEQIMAHFTDEYGGVPLYRALEPYVDRFYTTSWDECNTPGFTCEGVAGYVYLYQAPGMCPLYRGWRTDNGRHFETISYSETGEMSGAAHIDGIIGYVYPAIMGQPCPQ